MSAADIFWTLILAPAIAVGIPAAVHEIYAGFRRIGDEA